MGETIALAGGFPPASEADWERMALAALKGKPLDSLLSRTDDGLAIRPLEAARPPAGLGLAPAPWSIVQRLDHPDPAQANRLALDDLAGGASGLAIVVAGAAAAHGFGLPDGRTETLSRALDGVFLDGIAVRLEAGAAAPAAARALLDFAESSGADVAALDLCLGLDPLGDAAFRGVSPSDDWGADLAAFARETAARGAGGRLALADGRLWHAAGATEAQELAATLAAALAYLRALADTLPIEAAAARIGFSLAADVDQFATIAKLRALRLLWRRVCEDCGLPAARAHVHAETAWRGMTRRDPYTNVLRATVAGFAAAVGGADAITVLPFTLPLGLPDGFARRLARNTQAVLMEEAHLARVADPAAGSGSVEALTDALCGAAWDRFRDIEGAGGLAAALAGGAPQAAVAEAARTRAAAVASRRRPIVGTSEFALPVERPVAVLAEAPAEPPAALPVAAPLAGTPPPALAPHRLAAPFERLRDAADAFATTHGGPPRVLIVGLGKPGERAARTAWTKGVFAAGGIATAEIDLDGEADAATAAVAAARADGLAAACLSGTDAAYERDGPAVVAALASAGVVAFVAGRPGPLAEAWAAAGTAGFLYAGADVAAALNEVLARLGAGGGGAA
jgi:methylmalonyl-CoA mutase